MTKYKTSLNDKYELESGRIHLRGSQALVRMLMVQRKRDVLAGFNTGGLISGYRGSPMTAIDEELWRAGKLLDDHHIHFWPGTNEDLAATAVWGSQQTSYFGDNKYDGAFALWYGKGPGLDRSLDVIRQGNWHGTNAHGGVLIAVGDDPTMTSTINAYHSELLFEDLLMPVLYPADIQEVMDMGLLGIAMSRFSGCWVGYKMLPETVETSASVDANIHRVKLITPDFDFPVDGLNARHPDSVYIQEARIRNFRLPAALAFARSNKLNYVSHSSPKPRLGIVAMGKTWRDVQQALVDLGISEQQAADLSITILKVGMPFPMDKQTYSDFARGLEEVLVIEEKREQIEHGFREVCYALPESQRPRIIGRLDTQGQPLVSNAAKLTADEICQVIAQRIAPFHSTQQSRARVEQLLAFEGKTAALPSLSMQRTPYFCSGCPHSSSTKVPEGSKALGGVGCHYMATWMNRETHTFTQMGGEGVTWVGMQPFVEADHVFQNLGDGTYYHSGSTAIRATIAAGVNITYKILYNDAVAMTGGQPVDGPLSVDGITRQVREEGVHRIAVVTDEPEKYDGSTNFATGTSVHHRRDLIAVQQELRQVKGVSIIVYDQTCAAEKRRRRKRGKFPDPAKRLFINDRVCEGCGDCGVQSNCVSIQPLETEFGRKRKIDQSSCNKDYSCVEGFCPSFVTVLGGKVRKLSGISSDEMRADPDSLPEPILPTLPTTGSYSMLVTGVGGTGVVTIGALLGMAAHMDSLGIAVVDQLGFAQKGGAVMTHIRVARQQSQIHSSRINGGAADLLMACDMLVAGSDAALPMLDSARTRGIVNTEKNYTGDFTRATDLAYPIDSVLSRLKQSTDSNHSEFFSASRVAVKLLGDTIGANLLMIGFAWQKGLIPISRESISEAISLNGVAIEWNQDAFNWGRRLAHQPALINKILHGDEQAQAISITPTTVEDWKRKFSEELSEYQNAAYASRYEHLVEAVIIAEKNSNCGQTGLAEAVAKNACKLMAYKDEYEVARLYSSAEFRRKLDEQFEGKYKLRFNLAPPMIAPRDKTTGQLRKMEFGGYMLHAFHWLAKFKFLRGSRFDPFGYTQERKQERQLIETYELTVLNLLEQLDGDNHGLALEIAQLPATIRGYGHVKDRNIEQVHARLAELLAQWPSPVDQQAA